MTNVEKVELQSQIICWIGEYCDQNNLDEKKMEDFFEKKIEDFLYKP